MSKKTILVIGDSHSHCDHNNNRFDWLGKMIFDLKPDIIVDMGDFADMASLSSYDIGKKSHEGKRYKKDIEHAIDARKRLMAPTAAYNVHQASTHHTRYHPRLVALYGNHEDRIDRAVQSNAQLEGAISKLDLKVKELGWETVEFGDMIDIEGILFTHYFTGGVMGKPLGGLYPTVSMLRKYHCSCVQGHTHYFQERHELSRTGKIWAFIAGCYFDYDPDWTKAGIFYDRGVLLLHGVEDGNIEGYSWVGLDMIKERYATLV